MMSWKNFFSIFSLVVCLCNAAQQTHRKINILNDSGCVDLVSIGILSIKAVAHHPSIIMP
eukprot:scaffold858_cov123-Cylindrotheca_fusiformis.AAC.21